MFTSILAALSLSLSALFPAVPSAPSVPTVDAPADGRSYVLCDGWLFEQSGDTLDRVPGEYPSMDNGAYYMNGDTLYWYAPVDDC